MNFYQSQSSQNVSFEYCACYRCADYRSPPPYNRGDLAIFSDEIFIIMRVYLCQNFTRQVRIDFIKCDDFIKFIKDSVSHLFTNRFKWDKIA